MTTSKMRPRTARTQSGPKFGVVGESGNHQNDKLRTSPTNVGHQTVATNSKSAPKTSSAQDKQHINFHHQHLSQQQSSPNYHACQANTLHAGNRTKPNRQLPILPSLLVVVVVVVCLLSFVVSLHSINAQIIHNDVMPQQYQHNNILYFEVTEGAPNNTWVGQIRSVDGQPPYLVVPLPQTPESERKAAFSINFSTGDLNTNSVLDREHREQYHFIAIVREPFAEIKCTVTVKDVNDNAPMFLMNSPNETNFVIEMPEGQRGVRKALPIAVDYDTPLFGIKEFRIISGNTPSGMFQLVQHDAPARSTLLQNGNMVDDSIALPSTGLDNPQVMQQLQQQVLVPSQPLVMQSSVQGGGGGLPGGGGGSGLNMYGGNSGGGLQSSMMPTASSYNSIGGGGSSGESPIAQIATQSKFLIDLEVSQPLDRENQSSYQLVVEAIDGGQPPLLGKLIVTVNVQDVNDNAPIFQRSLYECHYKEDIPKGTIVHRVQASDLDLESNGQISYYIKRHSSSSQPINLINSNSSDSSEVQVSRYSTAVSMQAANGNNKLRMQTQQSPNSATAQQAGKYLPLRQTNAGLEVHDNSASSSAAAADLLASSVSHRSRQSSAYPIDQLFDIDQTKGEIYLVNQLDYETDQVHELIIEARDHGKPARNSTATVRVYVLDVPDDAPVVKQVHESENSKRPTNSQLIDPMKAESSAIARSGSGDYVDAMSHSGFNFQNLNIANWFAQMNSVLVFCIVLAVIFAMGFSVCLVRVKSRQPESDYNDTAGLTLSPNGGPTKASPNHSSNTIDHHSTGGGNIDSLGRYHHHDHQRRSNGSFAGYNGSGAFGTPNGKISRYATDSSNHYYNPYQPQQRSRHHSSTSHHMVPNSPSDHQMAVGGQDGDSRGGTLALNSHHHHHHHRHHLLGHSPTVGQHHSLEHHHHQFSGANHTTSSLTYAHHHSRAALLQQAHHHQSSHQLSSIHQVANGVGGVHNNKDGTMNSQHSAQHPPSTSPIPATPNTTHSSGLPPNIHDTHHNHGAGGHLSHAGSGGLAHNSLLPSLPAQAHHQLQSNQLPPTPCHNGGATNGGGGSIFAWPPPQAPGSTIGCYPGANGTLNGIHVTPGSTMDSCGTAGGGGCGGCGLSPDSQPPLDRWLDLGVSSQLIYAHDWSGTYNWDYLSDWAPEYHTLMPLIEAGGAAGI